jgi:hypothetical protein
MDWRTIVGTVIVGGGAGFILMFFWRTSVQSWKLIKNFPLNCKILTYSSLALSQVLVTGGVLAFLVWFSYPYPYLNWIVPIFGVLLGFLPLISFFSSKRGTKGGEKRNKKREG